MMVPTGGNTREVSITVRSGLLNVDWPMSWLVLMRAQGAQTPTCIQPPIYDARSKRLKPDGFQVRTCISLPA